MDYSRPRRVPALLLPLGLLLLLGAIVACYSTQRSRAGAELLVLASYDGVGADLAWDWIEQGIAADSDGLAALAREGFQTRRMRPVSPTLTSVSHASLITGALPERTGIVSNLFRPAGSPLDTTASGFQAPIESETLWQAAHRQGKRVGVLLWPGGVQGDVYPDSDLGMVWPEWPLIRSTVLDLPAEEAQATGQVEVPSQDDVRPLQWTLPMEARGAAPERFTAQVVAYDSTDDDRQRYDAVAVRVNETWTHLQEREWFTLEILTRGRNDDQAYPYGAWCKVLRLDRHRGDLRLLRGAFNRLIAYPEELRQRLQDEVGFWPGEPDKFLLGDWWLDIEQGIDLDTFLEQTVRLDRYLDRMAEVVLASEDLQLLITYHPTPDEYQHACLLVDRRQWAYSPGTALAGREGLKQVGASVDTSVATLWRALDPARDALVVLSDHGMAKLHDVIYFNQVLADAGLVEVEQDGDRLRVAATSPMRAVASGACTHIYLNRRGRDPQGVVGQADAAGLLQRAAQALAAVQGEDGQPAVERVLDRREAAEIGLGHANSGDLVVFLKPGYTGSGRLAGRHLEPTTYYGQHGHLNHHDQLCGMLFARGAGVRRTRIREVAATTVVKLVAEWMGIEPPRHRQVR